MKVKVFTKAECPNCPPAKALAKKLEEAGVSVKLHRYSGMMHGFIMLSTILDKGMEVLEEMDLLEEFHLFTEEESYEKEDQIIYSVRNTVLDVDLQDKLFTTTMISSRGCPFKCIYCSVSEHWGRLNTYMSPERVVAEMTYLKDKYGYNSIYFFDETFTVNRKRVENMASV